MQNEPEKIPVMIADDEKPIAQLIEFLLSEYPEIQVLNKTFNGLDTIEAARKFRPAVLFLDIEMPFTNGLAVAQQLMKEMPDLLIVFVTSHAHYAAEAYQFGAIDYIVKPVTQEAIGRSLARIKKHLLLQSSEKQIPGNNAHRLILSYKREVHLVNPSDILFIEKSERTCTVHLCTGTIATAESLNHLELMLDNRFFRCHKSFIVNVSKVEKILPIAERIYEVFFYNYAKTAFMSGKKLNDFYSAVKAC